MIKPDNLHELARLGATIRIKELEAELALIRKQFPNTRQIPLPAGNKEIPLPARNKEIPLPAKKRMKRYTMSAAQKAAVSKRMKAYWAKRKQAKK